MMMAAGMERVVTKACVMTLKIKGKERGEWETRERELLLRSVLQP